MDFPLRAEYPQASCTHITCLILASSLPPPSTTGWGTCALTDQVETQQRPMTSVAEECCW